MKFYKLLIHSFLPMANFEPLYNGNFSNSQYYAPAYSEYDFSYSSDTNITPKNITRVRDDDNDSFFQNIKNAREAEALNLWNSVMCPDKNSKK